MIPTPEDPRIARLRKLQEEFTNHPGAAPGGTGDTGLLTNDAQGYSDLLNRRSEAVNLQRDISGKGPLAVKGYSHPMWQNETPSTMWEPGQESAVSGRSFEQEQALQALKASLRRR